MRLLSTLLRLPKHQALPCGFHHLFGHGPQAVNLQNALNLHQQARLFLVFGEALVNWGKPATLCSHLLRRGGKDANDSAVSPARGTRYHVNQ
jgi:hypothetical protein